MNDPGDLSEICVARLLERMVSGMIMWKGGGITALLQLTA